MQGAEGAASGSGGSWSVCSYILVSMQQQSRWNIQCVECVLPASSATNAYFMQRHVPHTHTRSCFVRRVRLCDARSGKRQISSARKWIKNYSCALQLVVECQYFMPHVISERSFVGMLVYWSSCHIHTHIHTFAADARCSNLNALHAIDNLRCCNNTCATCTHTYAWACACVLLPHLFNHIRVYGNVMLPNVANTHMYTEMYKHFNATVHCCCMTRIGDRWLQHAFLFFPLLLHTYCCLCHWQLYKCDATAAAYLSFVKP